MTGAVKIELTNEDALAFRLFREHQDNFVSMLKAGVFETRSGVVSMSFNYEGILTQINKDVLAYKRPSSSLV